MRMSTQNHRFRESETGGDSASTLGCRNQFLTVAHVASPSVPPSIQQKVAVVAQVEGRRRAQ